MDPCGLFVLQYDIIGHSGEGPNFEIVKAGKPPRNNKERLIAVKVTRFLGNVSPAQQRVVSLATRSMTQVVLHRNDRMSLEMHETNALSAEVLGSARVRHPRDVSRCRYPKRTRSTSTLISRDSR